jgi:hypothetical protein
MVTKGPMQVNKVNHVFYTEKDIILVSTCYVGRGGRETFGANGKMAKAMRKGELVCGDKGLAWWSRSATLIYPKKSLS